MNTLTLVFLVLSSSMLMVNGEECLTLRGNVKCGDNNENNKRVYVRLVDTDRSSHDDLMDEGYTSKSGAFHLSGCASDPIGSIDPMLRIYHKCKGAPKMVSIVVPNAAINHEYRYTEVINLQRSFRKEVDQKSEVPVCQQRNGGLRKYFFF